MAALAIVAHEIGHALQDHHELRPAQAARRDRPGRAVERLGGADPVLHRALLRCTDLAWLGSSSSRLGAVFALMTLPVELDASRRGLRLLQTYNLTDGSELQGAKSVLDAAALTYVAALAQTLATLLYYVCSWAV